MGEINFAVPVGAGLFYLLRSQMKLVERIKATGISIIRAKRFVDETEIAKREAWLFENRAALESLNRGIEEAEKGEVYDLGSFAEFADDEID